MVWCGPQGLFCTDTVTITVPVTVKYCATDDHHSNALPTQLGRNLLGRRFMECALFVSCTTSHVGLCSFIESIEHDLIKAMKIQDGN